jgi:hypothetical protein
MLRFAFLTGVTSDPNGSAFSQVSIFSDLNQLWDISMEDAYAGVCGISAEELTGTFGPDIETLAEKNGKTYDEALAEMHKRYNGYHFSPGSEGIFNPFSVLNTLVKRRFEYYWFKTGTPTFLVKTLKETGFDLHWFSEGISISAQFINDYRAGSKNLTPLLYQSGYLTIKDYDPESECYTLGFPNQEVRYGFLRELSLLYTPSLYESQDFDILGFQEDLCRGDAEAFMNRMKAFIASIPYDLKYDAEKYYQNIFYLLFKLLGARVEAELRSARGRADAVVTTADRVFVFEFKLARETGKETELVESALNQIDSQGYLIPYSAGKRKLVKVGAAFNAETRSLAAWRIAEA